MPGWRDEPSFGPFRYRLWERCPRPTLHRSADKESIWLSVAHSDRRYRQASVMVRPGTHFLTVLRRVMSWQTR